MNDINTLMNRVQQINAKDPSDTTPSDIDDLVNFYRHRRSRKAELNKSRDISALDAIIPKPEVRVAPGVIRRFTRKPTP